MNNEPLVKLGQYEPANLWFDGSQVRRKRLRKGKPFLEKNRPKGRFYTKVVIAKTEVFAIRASASKSVIPYKIKNYNIGYKTSHYS